MNGRRTSGDGIDGTELANSKSRDQGAQPVDTAVAIGGIPRIEFVAVTDPAEVGGGSLDIVQELKVEIAGNAMDGEDVELLEASEEILCEMDCAFSGHCAFDVDAVSLKVR